MKINCYRKILAWPLIAVMFTQTACFDFLDEMEERGKQDLEARKDAIMEYMQQSLEDKYSDSFEVYDLTKGQNKSWFQYGVFPATAVCLSDEEAEEFSVEVKTNGERFDNFKDSYYGVLYGDEVKQELAELVSCYQVEDVQIYYLPAEDILTEADDLRHNLRVQGHFYIRAVEDLEDLCDLVDELNIPAQDRNR